MAALGTQIKLFFNYSLIPNLLQGQVLQKKIKYLAFEQSTRVVGSRQCDIVETFTCDLRSQLFANKIIESKNLGFWKQPRLVDGSSAMSADRWVRNQKCQNKMIIDTLVKQCEDLKSPEHSILIIFGVTPLYSAWLQLVLF